MIISHKHKFIFIKTTKAAGTSVEATLRGICGDRDRLTEIIDPPMPQLNAKYFRGHMSANKIKSMIPEKVQNTYFKFTIERNSFEKAISGYYYYQNLSPFINTNRVRIILKGYKKEFDKFEVDTLEDHHKYLDAFLQSGLYMFRCQNKYHDNVTGKCLVDKIYQYSDGIPALFDDLAIRFNVDRSEFKNYYINSGFRDKRFTNDQLLMGENSKFSNRIKERYAREIEKFGYKY